MGTKMKWCLFAVLNTLRVNNNFIFNELVLLLL